MTPAGAGDGERGLPLPTPVDPLVYVEYRICIPDTWQYRAALLGVITELGEWWKWQHTREDKEAAEQAASLFRMAALTAGFEGECMTFCEKLLACLQTDADVLDEITAIMANAIQNPGVVQDAISNFITGDQLIADYIQDVSSQGRALSTGDITTPMFDNCDEDALWGAVTALVEQMNRNNVDFFERLEVVSNNAERVSLIVGAVPIFETLPADEIVSFAEQLFENIFENYDAQIDTALLDEYKCAIFCNAINADCKVTFEGVFDYFSERLSAAVTVESAFADIVGFLATGTFTGTQIADFMFLAQSGVVRWANDFVGASITNLTQSLAVGSLTPNSGWSAVCDPCAQPPETRTPVVESLWDAPNTAGVLSGPDMNGVWTITTTARASDEAFVIRDVLGRPFKLTDKVYSAIPACQVWLLDEVLDYIACGQGDQYVAQTVDEFWSTFTTQQGQQSMQFKIVAP